MGHSTIHMTANLYTHLDPKHSKEAATKMDALLREEELLRRYWQPFPLVSKLSEADGAPLRVRLLGEDLVTFRDTEGKGGLADYLFSWSSRDSFAYGTAVTPGPLAIL